ncbi:MAG: hypothetical protein OCC45_13290 [Desulfotalea sp.]
MSFRDSIILLIFTFICWSGYCLEDMKTMVWVSSMLLAFLSCRSLLEIFFGIDDLFSTFLVFVFCYGIYQLGWMQGVVDCADILDELLASTISPTINDN